MGSRRSTSARCGIFRADKFHVPQHANRAVDEVRRAEFFRKGGRMREVGEGETLAVADALGEPEGPKRQELNTLFSMNRRLLKAYLLKESLERLWFYRYEGAMLRYLQKWIYQLRLAAPAAVREVGEDAARSPRRDSQLLPNQSAAGSG